jgi:hypothetical protein
MLGRYYVTGWNNRFGMWCAEVIEAKTAAIAKERYATLFASHRSVKAYELHKLETTRG